MSEPFRGNVSAMLERERAMIEANRDLKAEIERLRIAAKPPEPEKAKGVRIPLVIIAMCVVVQALLGIQSMRQSRASLGPQVAPASAPSPAGHGL